MAELRYYNKHMVLRCSYGENTLAKNAGKGKFDKKQGGWVYEPSLLLLEKLRATLPGLIISRGVETWEAHEIAHQWAIESAKRAVDSWLQVPAASKLYPFQRVGVNFMLTAKRVLLADDMGLGKTLQSIVACEELGAKRVLVICPNILKRTWEREIDKWFPGKPVTIFKGTRKQKEKIWAGYSGGYFVTNYEAMRRGTETVTEDGKEVRVMRKHDFVDDVSKGPWDVAIVDEAHNIKNRKAQQTEDVTAAVKNAEHVFLMTGTPIMNKVDELWTLLHILHPKRYSSFWEFVQTYADAHPGKFGWHINPRPTSPTKLRAEISHVFLRRTKEEVFKEMPPKVFQKVWVELEPEQRKLYNQMEAESFVDINEDDQVAALGVLAQITRLCQLAFSPALMGGPNISPKIDALMEVLAGTEEKVIVFSQHTEVLKLVAQRLVDADINYVLFTGDVPDVIRQNNVDRFQEDPEIKVFLATMQSGGAGITLTAATYVVLLDKHWTPAINDQAVDRAHRHGQTKTVTVIEILAKDTADEMVEEVLSGKRSIIESVIARRKQIRTLDWDLQDVV